MKEQYITKVKNWIDKWVIDLNLCPFASHPFSNGSIKYVVLPYGGVEGFIESMAHEFIHLRESPADGISTTVVIIPEGLSDFMLYLDVLETCNIYLEDTELDEDIQLASFHPDYQFGGTQPHDVSNYTNRSPYPLIHLLKAEEVEKAIENHDNTDNIPENNIKMMNEMGLEGIKEILDNLDSLT